VLETAWRGAGGVYCAKLGLGLALTKLKIALVPPTGFIQRERMRSTPRRINGPLRATEAACASRPRLDDYLVDVYWNRLYLLDVAMNLSGLTPDSDKGRQPRRGGSDLRHFRVRTTN